MKYRKLMMALLSSAMFFGACSSAQTPQETDLQATENEVEEVRNEEENTPDVRTIAAEAMANMGNTDAGYDVAVYMDTVIGQWALEQFEPWFLQQAGAYDQTSEENIAHWKEIGMDKTYFPGDDEIREWSLFVPEDYDESKSYPLVIVNHMGGANILMAENMGFVENAAENDYIVACVSWMPENLTEAQQASFDESGMKYYEAYVFKTALNKIKELVNIDEQRVYAAGFSGGGNAAAYAAAEVPELLAGVSPSTGAAIQTIAGENLSEMIEAGMPMMMVCGLYDAEQRWPITHEAVELGPVKNEETLAGRIENINNWNRAAGSDNTESEESVMEASLTEGTTAVTEFGLNFDETFDKDYDGIEYSFGDFYDENGNLAARYMSIEECPHFIAPHWAEEVYAFFSNFYRDAKTGQIEIAQ